MKSIRQLHDIHAGQTIYVLGGSAQMDMYRPEFFLHKLTIGVNWVYQFFPVCYTLARHLVVIREWDNPVTSPISTLVYPEITCDIDGVPSPKVPGYRFRDELRQYGSTTLTAVDFAAYMGAGRIILLGAEGYGGYMANYPIPETNQPWLNRSRFEMEALIERLERTGVVVDWNRLIP